MKSIFFLFVLTFVFSAAYSQSSDNLMGPQLKNQKVCEKQALDDQAVSETQSLDVLTGPVAKNKQFGKAALVNDATPGYSKPFNMTGPKAKNYSSSIASDERWGRIVVGKKVEDSVSKSN